MVAVAHARLRRRRTSTSPKRSCRTRLLKALQQWPYSGIPANPAGWLFQVARNGALDVLRRDALVPRAAPTPSPPSSTRAAAPIRRSRPDDGVIQDDELRMIFLCCHPACRRTRRVALSLKTGRRFQRARRSRAPSSTADAPSRSASSARSGGCASSRSRSTCRPARRSSERLDSVLEVIYLLFNEGYAAAAGTSSFGLDLCGEAFRLARLVAGNPATAPPAAHALLALIAFQIGAAAGAGRRSTGRSSCSRTRIAGVWDPAADRAGIQPPRDKRRRERR